MKSILLILVAVLAVEHAYGHMCLLFPLQRGPAEDINVITLDCKLMEGPCGNCAAINPRVTFSAGKNVSIIFQKNFNHFYKPVPGKFTIKIAKMEKELKFMDLIEVTDTDTPDGQIFTQNVMIPDMKMDHAVLQVVYLPNNPRNPKAFYQCADVQII